MSSTALYTDHYELTMLDAALAAGVAGRHVTFEVFTRRLPAGRPYGVFAGLERLLEAVQRFKFGPEELRWLEHVGIVSDRTLEWLAAYRFTGDIHAYPEGELYTGGSPVLTVTGTFAETVVLETVVLSILNHDSAVAAAASLITAAAGDRPVIEMGGRRTDPEAAVAAARAAYIGGLASTSNLEAGRRHGIPTAGTASHAFVLLFPDEKAAFEAQLAAMGPSTTLLVDTYETQNAIRLAVEAAGPGLAAVRIDSGELISEAARARRLLDSLGADRTQIVVTGDLDASSIESLSAAPADAYGAGTSVVMGEGSPTSGFVYKLVAVEGSGVEKRSPGKETIGGRKWARRDAARGVDIVSTSEDGATGDRLLQSAVVTAGVRGPTVSVGQARRRHLASLRELGPGRSLGLVRQP